MKISGYILIAAGFLAGALISVLDVERIIAWEGFISTIVAGVIGVVLVRWADFQSTRTEGKLAANLKAIRESMERIVAAISDLDGRKDTIDPYEVRHEIDKLFPIDLAAFADARESITHVYGLQAYADVMSLFAAGERYLNRVWSASADGYINEVKTYLGRTREQFDATLEKLQSLDSAAS